MTARPEAEALELARQAIADVHVGACMCGCKSSETDTAFLPVCRALIAATAELERIARVHAGDVKYGSAEHQEMYTPLARRLMGERDAAVDELATANAERARIDHLSRCSTIGCGSGGRCDHVGTEQYPCPIASGKDAAAERDTLLVRRDELLVTIRKLSREVPYEEEARSTATLIAEVGTLRSELAEMKRRIPSVDHERVMEAAKAWHVSDATHSYARLIMLHAALDALTAKETPNG